jgi:hypothetical protein
VLTRGGCVGELVASFVLCGVVVSNAVTNQKRHGCEEAGCNERSPGSVSVLRHQVKIELSIPDKPGILDAGIAPAYLSDR